MTDHFDDNNGKKCFDAYSWPAVRFSKCVTVTVYFLSSMVQFSWCLTAPQRYNKANLSANVQRITVLINVYMNRETTLFKVIHLYDQMIHFAHSKKRAADYFLFK